MNLRSAGIVLVVVALLGFAVPAAADYQAGMDAYGRGDWNTAAKEFAAVVQAHPEDPDFAVAFHMLGLTQLKLGENDAAVANLAHAVKLDGANAEFSLGLGQALLNNGEKERALGVLKSIDPARLPESKRTPYALLLTTVALGVNRPGDAVAVLETRLAESPNEAILHRALGTAYYQSKRRDEAIEAFAAAFAEDPDDTASATNAVKIALAQAARTNDAAASKRLSLRAKEIATSLAERSPGPDTAMLAGEAAMSAADSAAGLAWFDKANAARPKEPEILSHRGQALAALDRADEAVAAYEAALACEPEPALAKRIYTRMAGLYAAELDFDNAIRSYEKAGNAKRAGELRTLNTQYGEAAAQRRELADQAAKLEEMAGRLDALGEQEGASKMRARIDYVKKQIEAIDRNLARVRQVLQQD